MLVLFILLVIFALAMSASFVAKHRNEALARQADFLKENGATISADYRYEGANHTKDVRFIVDDRQKRVFVSGARNAKASDDTGAPFAVIPYRELSGCEVFEDGRTMGGVGRAVVGSILAGGVGAIVGAATATQKVTSFKIVLYKNSLQYPQLTITLIDHPVPRDSLEYKRAVEFSVNITASIKAIKSGIAVDSGDPQSGWFPEPERTRQSFSASPSARGMLVEGSGIERNRFGAASRTEEKAPVQQAAQSPSYCVFCRSQVPRSAEKCPRCGKPLHSGAIVVRCAFCSSLILKSDMKCQYCGCDNMA